ncbi:hypothetical protein ABMX65_13355 [Vibrio vulnificus]|uniref:hypothetical protein n=2 Tax=Vibrio vulnificus TaxID=672 RepID=UPI004059C694
MTKIRKEKAELSSAAKNKKLSTPPPRHQLSFPRMRGSIYPHTPEAAFGNALTAADNDESETNSNTGNEALKTSQALAIRWVPAFARMTKIRKEKAELSSAAKNKKLSTPPPRPQPSFPRMRGSIHPHVPEAAFGNVLTTTDNDESEANSNTDN